MNLDNWIFSKIRVWCAKQLILDECFGIKISHGSWNKSSEAESLFLEKTKEALSLIRSIDNRRFERIQNQIRHIISSELEFMGKYYPEKVCLIDLGRFDFEQYPEWNLYRFAGIIIHEATHGYLQDHGIRTTKKNQMRIEKICRSEENRFLSRINSVYGEELLIPFNPQHWDIGSPFNIFRIKFNRIKSEYKKPNQSVHPIAGSARSE